MIRRVEHRLFASGTQLEPSLSSPSTVKKDYDSQMTKDEAASALREIGTILELQGENPFKCRAYHTAARTLETAPADRRVAPGENHHPRHHRQASLPRKTAGLHPSRASIPPRPPGSWPKKTQSAAGQTEDRIPRSPGKGLSGRPPCLFGRIWGKDRHQPAGGDRPSGGVRKTSPARGCTSRGPGAAGPAQKVPLR
ncbi:MAG: hypothetical protein EBZ07_05510 [Verrucomicrobia bacterium]|nr:hypothetical protein [Verrucomicrobiota bacterium]